jgi:hypothetical protein
MIHSSVWCSIDPVRWVIGLPTKRGHERNVVRMVMRGSPFSDVQMVLRRFYKRLSCLGLADGL